MVRIRSFHPGDEPALHAIFYSAVHQLAATHYTAAQLAAWAPADHDAAQWAERIRRIQPFVAEIDGRPVGYADLQSSGDIDQFFVCGAHARQGVGQALMNHLLRQAGARDIRALSVLVSRNAEPFFLRNRFTVAVRQQVAVRGVILPNAWMTRTLP
ncbi:GNAT family N-acetyltransferase [Ralstonia syzygii subsp. celebesensis]|uniref:GNAT family N-acetyltransferase n=2 Tax=Ralstonia syzygii subsp. celebesensis TaxID=1310168 RepID=A0A1U9VMV6_9RALS|nr:GNAT family N-acetyltransferase [Ralstonia syzygii]AQW31643.1 GNAT family N-acetyltransferase [blood disease bacterium A2-HR MARDI]QQV58229.1 GNAT family N-acetyltransferase [Ralstonia syzygii subsp. celebesensis]CCA83841.1 putative acyltransferase with acyl-CoA N-acyltransferase domain [blood disease bacterium R229]